MPNHVTTRCFVSGSEESLEDFSSRILMNDSFDFGLVIPKPAEVATSESSTDAFTGFYALTGKHASFMGDVKDVSWEQWVRDHYNYSHLSSREELLAGLTDAQRSAGERAVRCYEASGYVDWYHWSIDNWGTKWNAYDISIVRKDSSKVEIVFNTAWSFPLPVFTKMQEMFPELVFTTYSVDEGWIFVSHGETQNGIFVYDSISSPGKEKVKEIYRIVFQEDMEDDEEEEEEEEEKRWVGFYDDEAEEEEEEEEEEQLGFYDKAEEEEEDEDD